MADDGNGFGTRDHAAAASACKNVRERLHLAYGADAAFDIAANFPAGVAATITVPDDRPDARLRHD